VPVNASRVLTGNGWGATGGASAPNRPAPYPLIFTLYVISDEQTEIDAAEKMIPWWSQIGIQVTMNVISEDDMISVTYGCSGDFYLWSWAMHADPTFALNDFTTSQILSWQDVWFSNATYDQLFGLQETQVNPYQRQQTVWEMQKILYDDAVYLVLWYPYLVTTVRNDTFTGWTALGDWQTNPGLTMMGWGDYLIMLTLSPVGTAASQAAPVSPYVIVGVVVLVVAVVVAAVLIMRRRRRAEKVEETPLPPPKPPGQA
jgi:peptide/nickel transport system substrate-binding protein